MTIATRTVCLVVALGGIARAQEIPIAPRPAADIAPRLAVDPAPQGIVFAATFSSDGKQLALARFDKTVTVHDWPSGKVRTVLGGHKERVWIGSFSPDGNLMATSTGEFRQPTDPGELRIWDLKTGKVKTALEGHQGLVFHAIFSPDGKMLLSTSWDGTIKIWDVETGKERASIDDHKQPVRMVVFAPDGKTFASAGFDGTVRFWDAATYKHQRTIQAHSMGGVQCVIFTPDGKHMATASRPGGSGVVPGEVKLWEVASGRELMAVTGHKGYVLSLDLSPDGAMLAVGGGLLQESGEVRLYETATGQPRAVLDGHKEWVESVRFSLDGKVLVSAGGFTQGAAGQAFAWVLADLRKNKLLAENPSPDELRALWELLADKEAAKAYQGILSLAAAPKSAAALLGEKLQPVEITDKRRIERLIEGLDSDVFKVREQSSTELGRLGEVAAPALREAMEKKNSAELQLRATRLLRQLDLPITEPETLRTLRAVEVLELAGTAEARTVLEALAKGSPEARLTRQASTALKRLQRP
jgi:WD domain, G-beta repeat